MRVLIDGDACPDKDEIYALCLQYHVEMIVFVDYAHISNEYDYQVIYCEVGRDSVDKMILNHVQNHDIIITQDYGLSSLLLLKQCYVLHPSGMIVSNENIDTLLMHRYIGSINRKRDKHIKGPKKRTEDVKERFLNQLERLLTI